MIQDLSKKQLVPTPISKVLIVVGLISITVFFFLYKMLSTRNQILRQEHSKLEIEGNRNFSIIKDYHKVQKSTKTLHLYTYAIVDEFGNYHEVTEFVDPKTHSRLRIGDNAMIYSKSIQIVGSYIFLSKILGNTEIYSANHFFEYFSLFGIIISSFLVFLGLVKGTFFKKLNF